MAKTYFNKLEFKQAFSLSETNPLEAKVLYEKYLEKYPKDYSAYTYYCSLLIGLGEFDSAKKILDFVEMIVNKDENFNNFSKVEKSNFFKKNIFYSRVKMLSYQKRYDELYKYILNHPRETKDLAISNVLFYCRKKLGMLNLDKREANSYLFRQIVRYEESDFLNHIQKHLFHHNENVDKPNKNVFAPNFPIDEVIKEVKKHIPCNTKIFSGFFNDSYIFKYNECGRDNNKLVNYFRVICFNDTSDIITMCPVSGYEVYPYYIDLNYMIQEESNKVKKISQIDKFNRRYNINQSKD